MNAVTRLLLLLLAAGCVCCGQTQKRQAAGSALPDGVEVLSFHGKKRCPTCTAIERLTREVVETHFAVRIADGSLAWRVVDIDRDEELAGRYEVAWSSLLVCRRKGGEETVNDLTRFAFANARANPEKFKAELKSEIEKMLAE